VRGGHGGGRGDDAGNRCTCKYTAMRKPERSRIRAPYYAANYRAVCGRTLHAPFARSVRAIFWPVFFFFNSLLICNV